MRSFLTNYVRNSLGSLTSNPENYSALRASVFPLSTNSNIYEENRTINKKYFHNSPHGSQLLTGCTFPTPLLKVGPLQTLQTKRHKWQKASLRVGRGPRGNNGKRSPLTIQGAFQCHAYKKPFKKTLSRRFPGHVDVFNRKG